MKVWEEEEDYKNLMFTKESVQEDLENEMKKMEEEIKEKDLVIEKLNQKIRNFRESDIC